MAYQYWCHRGEPQRTLFVGFENGYHGDTFGAMAVGRDPVFFGRFEPLLFRSVQVHVSPERLDVVLKENQGKVAAVIIEPLVQGAGGMQMHSPDTLRDLCDVARQNDVLLIADEVMTGGGRTGTLWAHQPAEVIPDLICAGKTLTGGMMPLAATLVAPRIVEAFLTPDRTRTFFHGHSHSSPLACAVAASPIANRCMASRCSGSGTLASWPKIVTCGGIKNLRVQDYSGIRPGWPGWLLSSWGRIRGLPSSRACFRPLGNVCHAPRAPPPVADHRDDGRLIAESSDHHTDERKKI